mgnify:CR=1 FL=1
MIDFEILATGSAGNAIIINDTILIDCGVPFKTIRDHYKKLKLVLLTHIHGDHFNKSTIRRLAKERPTLRFGCCQWLVKPLLSAGVDPRNIDVMEPDVAYRYGAFDIIPVSLVHDVPNCGYKIHFSDSKMFYATDTNNLNGIVAKNYDLYMVEANYGEEEIRQRIAAKKEAGEYAYEYKVLQNHLSVEKCNDFLYRNMGPKSEYVYLHQHEGGDWLEGQAD